MEYEVEKLISAKKEHGKIIVGLDFDDTIFPLHDTKDIRIRTMKVKSIIRENRDKYILCLWTVANKWSIKYKLALMSLWGIPPDYINESPVMQDGSPKPFFNILLDDNAGLDESIRRLEQFNLITTFTENTLKKL